MSIESRSERGKLTVAFCGDIDEFACRTLRGEIDALIDEFNEATGLLKSL